MRELPVGTVTFLFTDIEGSTRILRDLGEKYSELLSVHSRIIREIVNQYNGIEVTTDGDSFFCVFQDAVCAINAVTDTR
jgi:class 3 adenylate cyclase